MTVTLPAETLPFAWCSLFPEGAAFVSVDLFTALDRPDRLEIEILLPETRSLPHGTRVEFRLGGTRRFAGLVERSGLRIDGGGTRASLVAYAAYESCRRRQGYDCYYQMSDSEIASRIAGELGLTPHVETTPVVHGRLERRGDPLCFLRARARRVGFELAVSDDVLYFTRRLPLVRSPPKLVRVGEGIVNLEIEERGPQGRAGELRVLGDPIWRPLLEVDIRGAGSLGDGVYRVIRCRHHLDAGGYDTVIQFQEEGVDLGATSREDGRVNA
jgi:hypothetical protein